VVAGLDTGGRRDHAAEAGRGHEESEDVVAAEVEVGTEDVKGAEAMRGGAVLVVQAQVHPKLKVQKRKMSWEKRKRKFHQKLRTEELFFVCS